MNDSQPSQASFNASRFFPLLLILFAGSGFSALIYEIVWYQLLQLAIGSTSVSLGVLLATFMGGLCIGSILLPRLGFGGRHPLRVYAALEFGIGIFGILVLFGMPLINRAYISGSAIGMPGMLLRGLIAAVCMLPPTILMGASLPAIVGWIDSTPRGVSWWGFLYGGNTLGAVLGCVAAGFYLLRVYDMAVATYFAVTVNILVALVSLWLAGKTPAHATTAELAAPANLTAPLPALPADVASNWTIYLTIALSGASALGAEVVWTRLVGMLLGSTVYVFSIILAVFLLGLAIGGGIGAWVLRKMNARLALGWSQILLALAIAWTAYMITDSLPYWPALLTTGPAETFRGELIRCLVAILPPTIFWGASFPLAMGAIVAPGAESGRTVGGVYAANTLGAIIGALGVSLILIPAIGTQQCQRLLLLLAAASALFVLVPYIREHRSKSASAVLLVSLAVAVLLAWRIDPIPGKVIAYGRWISSKSPSSKVLYTVEGINSSVAITQWDDGAVEVDVNGHVEATTEPFDMKLQRMVGHLPALLHPHPVSVLGIGFGAGVSAGTFTTYPSIEKITVCEIEPVIPPTSTRYFAQQDYDVLHNPKTQIIYDDARHYVLTTTNKYDIIASDPLDVFVKGTAAIYSKEYFEAVKAHLNPGGMFSLYVPLYETDERTIKSELATFFAAFPNGTVWANTIGGQGYDMVFMGQAEPLKINLDEIQQRLSKPEYAAVAQSLREIGVNSAVDLVSTFTAQKSDLASWLQGADINHDRDLRLQYIAGWGINSDLEDTLYREMLRYRQSPANIFSGSPEQMLALFSAMSGQLNAGDVP